jgi:carboxyl-terminal processing protease
MTAFFCFFFLLSSQASDESRTMKPRFERVIGDPRETVQILAGFPWRNGSPDALEGFHRVAAGEKIRIVAVERPVRNSSQWKHWESPDGAVWIDLIHFTNPFAAAELLRSGRQRHSGFYSFTQYIFFSESVEKGKDALGTAMIAADGSVLNVGVKIPVEVSWHRTLPDADRNVIDAAITRLQSTLQTLGRALLDPTYVSFAPKLAPTPEALPTLRMAGFARFWSLVKHNFVFLDKHPELNWDTILEQYLPRVASARDDATYVRLMQEAVALLKDGHTEVYPSAMVPRDAPPVVLEPVEGRPVAAMVGSLPDLSPIQPGMELVAIDGTSVDTIIARDLDPYIASSTPQDRQLRRMRMLLVGPPDTQIRTKWLTLDGKTVEVTLTRNGSKHRDALKFEPHDRFEHKKLPGNVAYIALNDFSSAKTADSFESKFDELRQAGAWIIDLRMNGGGSSDIGYRILAHFIDAPARTSTWRTRQYNPTFQAWGKPQTWYEGEPDKVEPAAGPRYSGPIYVLTSPSTCSAAEDFLIPLKMSKRITIVGEPTCGSSGQPLMFNVYGASGRVCTKWDRFPDGTEFVGVGVLPDVKAAKTKRDVVSSRDAVLESAIDLASHRGAPTSR